jgi:hypothetical protein
MVQRESAHVADIVIGKPYSVIVGESGLRMIYLGDRQRL